MRCTNTSLRGVDVTGVVLTRKRGARNSWEVDGGSIGHHLFK